MKKSPTTAVLKNPFPSHQQLIDHQSLHGSPLSTDEVRMMSSETVNLNTRSHSYDPHTEKKSNEVQLEKPSNSTPPPNNSLHIEKPILEEIFHPPKSTLHKSIINPNARATQYYNIVEDLAQAPCAMLALEVLQTCPTQRKNLLTALGAMDPKNSNVVTFKLDDFKTRLSHQLDFQISTKIVGNTIRRTVLDKGASTSIVSLTC